MLTGEPGCRQGERGALHPRPARPAPTSPSSSSSSASIAPERFEEVLFGRESPERGVEPGLLEQADGGIIYFDEVADMPLGTQSKILRVLTEQHFTRVGGSERVRVDIRVISSTNHDLRTAIEGGRFRRSSTTA